MLKKILSWLRPAPPSKPEAASVMDVVSVVAPLQPPTVRAEQFADVTDQEVAQERDRVLRAVVASNNRNVERHLGAAGVVSLAAWKAWRDPAPTDTELEFLDKVTGGARVVK